MWIPLSGLKGKQPRQNTRGACDPDGRLHAPEGGSTRCPRGWWGTGCGCGPTTTAWCCTRGHRRAHDAVPGPRGSVEAAAAWQWTTAMCCRRCGSSGWRPAELGRLFERTDEFQGVHPAQYVPLRGVALQAEGESYAEVKVPESGIPRPDDQIAQIESDVVARFMVCFQHAARGEREPGPGDRRIVFDSSEHPGLQLDVGAESSLTEADPGASQEEGLNMALGAVHEMIVFALQQQVGHLDKYHPSYVWQDGSEGRR